MTRRRESVAFPVAVVIDSREQAGYSFRGLFADSADGVPRSYNLPLVVPTVTRALPVGDYSLDGYEHLVAIERKSLSDLYSTLSQGRDRFERELERSRTLDFFALVIESSYERLLASPPRFSDLSPRSVLRTLTAYMQRHNLHVVPAGDRRLAELWTFRALQRYMLDHPCPPETRPTGGPSPGRC
jgi:ERCC4-type nuclease